MLGLFKITSIPIDNTTADVWVGAPKVPSVDLGKPIPVSFVSRVGGAPGVTSVEPYIANFANFAKPGGGTELCYLLGCRLDDDAAVAPVVLTREQRDALTMPGAVIADESDVTRRLEFASTKAAKINGKEVRLVGTVRGLKSLAAPWLLCSEHTARQLLGFLLPRSTPPTCWPGATRRPARRRWLPS